MKTKEQEQFEKEISELAQLLMQSENLEASKILLIEFAEKHYGYGRRDAENDASDYIQENYL